jgi:CRISPR-associated protein Csb2
VSSAICICATFLTGRYHGEEWPPSPARLLQALVAGVKTGNYRSLWSRVEPGLRWLERQPAPAILARPMALSTGYRLAVPNNDFDSVARAWAAGRPANPADLRTMKTVIPKSIEADQPHLRYVWPLPDNEDHAIVDSLQPLADCLYALGWGVDMAYARLEVTEPQSDGYEEWVPSAGGTQLKTPVAGFLADLETTYAAFTKRTVSMNTDTRPTVYRLQRYRLRGAAGFRHAVLTLRSLGGTEGYSVGWHAGMEVAAWLRHASAKALRRDEAAGIDVDSFVLGHTEGEDDRSHRLSFVPLASIGHANADGRVRRVMLVEPPSGDGAVVERLEQRLRGATVTKVEGVPVCTLGADDRMKVTRYYTATARVWRSVTPVILHGFNAHRGRVSIGKTDALLRRAFEMAGVAPGGVESVVFQPAPLWPGTGAAAQVRVPQHLQNYPRYHVEVVFREPIVGPVLAGIGRHYGIGVFAAPGD